MAMVYAEKPVDKKTWYYTEEDNERVLQEIRVWRPKRLAAKDAGDWSLAPVPEFVGACILKIAQNIAKRYNYNRHHCIDDMVMAAVEYTFRYLHNFDVEQVGERSGRVNFHSYCTRIIDREFGKYILGEHKQDYLKFKSFELVGGYAAFEDEIGDHPELLSVIDNTDIGRDISTKVAEYEQKDQERKEKERERRQAKAEPPKLPSNGLARLLMKRNETKDGEQQ